MKFIINDIDTPIFEKVVGDIKEFDSSVDFKSFEEAYVKEHNPFYVLVKIPSTDLQSVHILEDNGFKFVETQIKVKTKVKKLSDNYLGCNYSLVNNEKDLQDIVKIARTTFTDDRITVDKELSKYFNENISAKRYEVYIRRSYEIENQRLYKVFEDETGRIIAFFSFMLLENNEALSFLEGVSEEVKGFGYGVVFPIMYMDELAKLNVKRIYGAFSVRNIAIMNQSFNYSKSKAVDSFIIMRKIYT